MMQSHDCWYCTPVIVAVIPWMVSDSRWAKDRVEAVSQAPSLTSLPRRGGLPYLYPPWGYRHQ